MSEEIKEIEPDTKSDTTSAAVEHSVAPNQPILQSPNEKLLAAGKVAPVAWRNWYRWIWAVLAAIVLVTYVGVYAFHIQQSWFLRLTHFVPTPFAFVGDHPLWLNDFDDDVTALTHFYSAQSTSSHVVMPTENDIRRIAETNMIRRAKTNVLAAQYGVSVSQSDVNQEYEQVVTAAGSEANVQKTISNLWGWSIKQYQQNVIQPYLLKTKLLAVLKQDPVIGPTIGATTNVQSLDSYLDTLKQPSVTYWYQVAS